MIVLIAFFIILFKLSIKKERRMIYNELIGETDIIPENHLIILSSKERNNKGGSMNRSVKYILNQQPDSLSGNRKSKIVLLKKEKFMKPTLLNKEILFVVYS